MSLSSLMLAMGFQYYVVVCRCILYYLGKFVIQRLWIVSKNLIQLLRWSCTYIFQFVSVIECIYLLTYIYLISIWFINSLYVCFILPYLFYLFIWFHYYSLLLFCFLIRQRKHAKIEENGKKFGEELEWVEGVEIAICINYMKKYQFTRKEKY